jgi:hypothetical protein
MNEIKGRLAAYRRFLQGFVIQDITPGQLHQGVSGPGPELSLANDRPRARTR